MADNSGKKIVHKRADNYSVNYVTGAVATLSTDNTRLEVSLYSERVMYSEEGMEQHPSEPELYRPDGNVSGSMFREHVTGINVSLEEAKEIADLITQMVERVESNKGSQ